MSEANLLSLETVQDCAIRLSNAIKRDKPKSSSTAAPAEAATADKDGKSSKKKRGGKKKKEAEAAVAATTKSATPTGGAKKRARAPDDLWSKRTFSDDFLCSKCNGRHNKGLKDYYCEGAKEAQKGNNSKSANSAEVFNVESVEDPIPYRAMIDSGCTDHMTPLLDHLDPSTVEIASSDIRCAGSTVLKAQRKGTIHLEGVGDGIDLKDVLVVPGLRRALISVARCNDQGYDVHFLHEGNVEICKGTTVTATGRRDGNLFWIDGFTTSTRPSFDAEAFIAEVTHDIAHARTGHAEQHVLKRLSSVTVDWVQPTEIESTSPCEACAIGKNKRLPFPNHVKMKRALGELIHTDIQGPFRIPGPSGERYILSFIEDAARYAYVAAIADRKEGTVFEHWKTFSAWLERLTKPRSSTYDQITAANTKEHSTATSRQRASNINGRSATPVNRTVSPRDST